MSSEYFTVASYDITFAQDNPITTPSGVLYGLHRELTLRSASDNPTRMRADIYFTPNFAEIHSSIGWVQGLGSASLYVSAAVPLEEFDHWHSMLKGDRQVSFMFIYTDDPKDTSDDATGTSDLAAVRLTTAQDPNATIFGVERSSDRIQTLPLDLQRIVTGPS
jgi:hypothetical protein